MTQKERVKDYLKVINPNYNNINQDTINFVIDEIIDRVLLYLNREDMPENIERVVAKIVNNGINKTVKEQELVTNGEVDRAISSISDNGQSVSYSNEITNYFATAKDNELFSGFESLLSRYRRIKVVHPNEF